MDADTTAKLQSAQQELQSQVDSLQAAVNQIVTLEGYVAAAALTPSEALSLRDAVFADLPNQQETQGQLDRVSAQLAAVTKLLAANP